ncbi:hypothetical protein BU26DRAFT_176677 [Trematosphaeria pertusa]|uniref:Uncharacterized protein n=1 Tax=Trematosphaeria pertusa TaxID=390896 RepID=A0A6A6HTV3_9PLEO|nr:uncharacterized protein BU26DRAFT_176677 [Trematosphaeria pertusa]KAF2241349.1 hypothetical protein BU26DRAFT_176677 [Trematosphaeria pertusa]
MGHPASMHLAQLTHLDAGYAKTLPRGCSISLPHGNLLLRRIHSGQCLYLRRRSPTSPSMKGPKKSSYATRPLVKRISMVSRNRSRVSCMNLGGQRLSETSLIPPGCPNRFLSPLKGRTSNWCNSCSTRKSRKNQIFRLKPRYVHEHLGLWISSLGLDGI